jgi:uncharacterized membrane protein
MFAALAATRRSRFRSQGRLGLPTPAPDGLWSTTLQWIVAALVTLALAFLTYTRGGWVPILSSFDLGLHEFGHLLFFWAPDLIVWPAGSLLQVIGPLLLAGYFLHRRDRFAVVLMVAWAAESLNNVSVYIGDAQRMVLPLFGDDGSGAGHDWHNILTRLGLLERTDAIASFVHVVSILLFVAALGLAAWWFAQPRLARRRGSGSGRDGAGGRGRVSGRTAAPPPPPRVID